MGSFLSATDMQIGLAGLWRARVGARPVRVGPDRPPPQSALAIGRRNTHLQPVAGLPGRLRGVQHAQCRVPRGRECVLAVGRLARRRAGHVVREVRRRLRVARPPDPPVHAGRGGRGQPGLRRPRRGRARAATSSAPSTLWSDSATASGARPWPRPRTTTGGRATARSTTPPARPDGGSDARGVRTAAPGCRDRGGAGRVRRTARSRAWRPRQRPRVARFLDHGLNILYHRAHT